MSNTLPPGQQFWTECTHSCFVGIFVIYCSISWGKTLHLWAQQLVGKLKAAWCWHRYVHLVNNSIIKNMEGFKMKNEAWAGDAIHPPRLTSCASQLVVSHLASLWKDLNAQGYMWFKQQYEARVGALWFFGTDASQQQTGGGLRAPDSYFSHALWKPIWHDMTSKFQQLAGLVARPLLQMRETPDTIPQEFFSVLFFTRPKLMCDLQCALRSVVDAKVTAVHLWNLRCEMGRCEIYGQRGRLRWWGHVEW